MLVGIVLCAVGMVVCAVGMVVLVLLAFRRGKQHEPASHWLDYTDTACHECHGGSLEMSSPCGPCGGTGEFPSDGQPVVSGFNPAVTHSSLRHAKDACDTRFRKTKANSEKYPVKGIYP